MIGNVKSSSTLAVLGSKSSTVYQDPRLTRVDSGKSVNDKIEISKPGKLLNKLGDLLHPTWENVAGLKEKFSAMLSKVLSEAGIDSDPPLIITQDVNSGVFSVKGANPKAAQVQDLLNSNDELKMLHHNMQAIASHIPALEEGLKFQNEYRAASSAADIQSVVAKYSHLLYKNAAHHFFTTIFNSEGAILQMDGKKVA